MHLQAVTFLVIHQKHKKSLEEITNDLCPVLSVQQLYRISTMYWDDRYNTETVAHEVRCEPCAAGISWGAAKIGDCHQCGTTIAVEFQGLSLSQMGLTVQSSPAERTDCTSGLHETCLCLHITQVLARMKQLMVDNNTAASHSFLLDDDSSIPFSLDDIAALMEDKVRFCDPTAGVPSQRANLRIFQRRRWCQAVVLKQA
jgi:hypothetical protein